MAKNEKLLVEVQYFDGCPNSKEIIESVIAVIKEYKVEIEFKKVLVEDNETAERIKFRGSPTILINGEDLLKEPAPEKPAMMCRYYKDGLPSREFIYNIFKNLL